MCHVRSTLVASRFVHSILRKVFGKINLVMTCFLIVEFGLCNQSVSN